MDRMELYNYSMMGKIIVPMISKDNINVTIAFDKTIGKIMMLAKQMDKLSLIQEVLDKGEAYHNIDKNVRES